MGSPCRRTCACMAVQMDTVVASCGPPSFPVLTPTLTPTLPPPVLVLPSPLVFPSPFNRSWQGRA